MDRRDFFLTIMTTSLLTPMLLRAKPSSAGFDLYMIGDRPDLFMPSLLDQAQEFGLRNDQSYSFLNSYSQEHDLKQALSRTGWTFIEDPPRAGWALSFRTLHQKALPSFTLVRSGRIWDIRTQKLHDLWQEMNSRHQPSSLLTTASFRYRSAKKTSGKHAAVYIDGKRADRIALTKDNYRMYRTRNGNIAVRVENSRAVVTESSCKNKVCCCTAPVFQTGERIICAPNHFMLEVEGAPFLDTVIG
jgi:hypothetical protein